MYYHEQSVIDHYARNSLYTRSFCTEIKLYTGRFCDPHIHTQHRGTDIENLLFRAGKPYSSDLFPIYGFNTYKMRGEKVSVSATPPPPPPRHCWRFSDTYFPSHIKTPGVTHKTLTHTRTGRQTEREGDYRNFILSKEFYSAAWFPNFTYLKRMEMHGKQGRMHQQENKFLCTPPPILCALTIVYCSLKR